MFGKGILGRGNSSSSPAWHIQALSRFPHFLFVSSFPLGSLVKMSFGKGLAQLINNAAKNLHQDVHPGIVRKQNTTGSNQLPHGLSER